MKKDYHSIQEKAFNTLPRSEFIGVALGFAVGMIVHGILKIDGSLFESISAAIGFIIGYIIDKTFYLEKDVPIEDLDLSQQINVND